MRQSTPSIKVGSTLLGDDSLREKEEDFVQSSPTPAIDTAYRDLSPTTPLTLTQQREIDQTLEADKPELWDATKMAVSQEWSLMWALSGHEDFIPDENFELTPEKVKKLGEGIPTEYWDYFKQAHSDAHAAYLREQLQKDLEMEQELSKLGYTGAGIRIAAAIADPLGWAIGAAAVPLTGGVGTAGVLAHKVSRLSRAVRAGTAAAAGNAATEAVITSNKPTSQWTDILYAGALGFGIGGTLGALARNPYTAAEAETIENASRSMMRQIEEEELQAQGVELGDSTGAMRASIKESLREDTSDFITAAEHDESLAPRSAFSRVRFDVVGRLKASNNPVARALGGMMGEDATGNLNREIPTVIGATERQALLQRQYETRWRKAYEPALRQWIERQNGNRWNPITAQRMRHMFSEQVTAYVRSIDGSGFDPEVKAAGDAFRNLFNDYRKHANQPGADRGEFFNPVKGFGTLEENPNYVPRIFDYRKFDEMLSKLGDFKFERFLARAIRANSPEILEEDALKAASAYLKTVRRLRAGIGVDTKQLLSGADAEEMTAFLRQNTDLTDLEIEEIVDALKSSRKGGGVSHGKSRMDFDENYSEVINGEQVRISDFFNNDIEYLFNVYNRRMSGAIALAQIRLKNPRTGEYLIDGVKSPGEWETVIAKVRAAGDEMGMTKADIDSDVEKLNFLYRAIAGIPTDADTKDYAQFLRVVRDYNFARVMGQVGWAQLAEIGTAMGSLGIKAMLKGMPSFRTLWRNAKTGKLDDELAEEIESITGLGADWLRGVVINRWDEINGAPDTVMGNNKWYDRIDTANQFAKRGVSAISGMSTVNTLLHRWISKALANKFAALAAKPTKANKNRLRTLGLSDEMTERIYSQFKQYSATTNGLTGKKVRRINLDNWDDLQAAAAFREAIFRWSRRIVQENDPGMTNELFTGPVAKTILQFRTFMLGAWTKQFLHNIHMRDFNSFAIFMGSSLAAGLSYIGQTYMQSIGREDQEEFLNDRLSPEKIGLAAFQRAGYASLMPMVMDTAMFATGQDPLFDFRTTGQPSDIIFGNPSVSLFSDGLQGVGGGIDALIDGRSMSQEEIKQAVRTLPFQNTLPIVQTLNAILGSSGLPERAPKD